MAKTDCYLLELPESIHLDVRDSAATTKEDAMRILYEIWGGKNKTPLIPKELDIRKVDFSGFKGSSSSESLLRHVGENRYEFTHEGKRYPARCDPIDSVAEGYKIRGLECQVTNIGRFTHIIRVFETELEMESDLKAPVGVNGICGRTIKRSPFEKRMEDAGVKPQFMHRAVEQLMETAKKIEECRRKSHDATFVLEHDHDVPQRWMLDEEEIRIEREATQFRQPMMDMRARILEEKKKQQQGRGEEV